MSTIPENSLRPFAWDDLDRLVRLMEICEATDRNDEAVQREIVRTNLSTPGRDPENTIQVVDDGRDVLRASCAAWPTPGVHQDTIHVGVRIHPESRSAELYADLLQAAEERARELYRPTVRPVSLQAGAHEQPVLWRETVEAAGYTPVRWFIDMRRPLDGELIPAEPPDGCRIAFLDDGIEPLAVKRALDEAFVDHWNPQEFSDEQFLHWAQSAMFRADLTPVALGLDGDVVGGAIVTVRDAGAPPGSREARVDALGVRKPFRGQGLARAMLSACLVRLKEAGVDSVSLDVDADNPTGATALYRSVGFEERHRMTVYSKPFAAA